MNKEVELKKSKRTALLFLAAAALIFVVTAFLPHSFAVDCLKAVSEAAMVGALANWLRWPRYSTAAYTLPLRGRREVADTSIEKELELCLNWSAPSDWTKASGKSKPLAELVAPRNG